MPLPRFLLLLAAVLGAAGLTVALGVAGGVPAGPLAMAMPLAAVLALRVWRRR